MKNSKCVHASTSRSLKPTLCLLGLTLLVTGLWLTGCKPAASVSEKPDPTGTYTLVTMNGNPLPYTPPHEGGAPQITSGSFTIKPDGTCGSKMNFTLPAGGASSREVSATFKQEGDKLHMQWQGAGQTIGTVASNTFTMDNEGVRFAYRKGGSN
jgi:hypothetical protein